MIVDVGVAEICGVLRELSGVLAVGTAVLVFRDGFAEWGKDFEVMGRFGTAVLLKVNEHHGAGERKTALGLPLDVFEEVRAVLGGQHASVEEATRPARVGGAGGENGGRFVWEAGLAL